MPKPRQLPPLEDLQQRTDQVIKILELLEQEIQEILTTGKVAPAGCWIVRYQARGRKGTYWYYKLQATVAIFPSKNNPQKLSKYKHLGKAGSLAYLDTVEQVARRAKIESLQQAIDTQKQGLSDLTEEASKYK
jgi:hypothetical protein